MDKFEIIDMETWPRAEIFNLYTKQWPGVVHTGTRILNAEKTIHYLKKNGIKIVPSLLYMVTECVNAQSCYRISFSFWMKCR